MLQLYGVVLFDGVKLLYPKEKSMYQKYKMEDIGAGEYRNYLAINRGYGSYNNYRNKTRYLKGTSKELGTNPKCASYLGVYIAERILSKVFENVTRMPYSNKGYDFICRRGYKIDVKSSSLQYNDGKKTQKWTFHINNNIIADYFLCIGFDNRDNLNPLKIWLINGKDTIQGKILYTKKRLVISNTIERISEFQQFEQKDKLEKTIACCETLKE